MKPRARKQRPFPVLRRGELKGNRLHVRKALVLAIDELRNSGSRRLVIRLDEKEPVHA